MDKHFPMVYQNLSLCSDSDKGTDLDTFPTLRTAALIRTVARRHFFPVNPYLN